MRRPDNKKDEQHFQTPPMASQKKRSHDFGPSCGPLGSCWLNHTQGRAAQGTHISSYPAITRWSWPPCAGPTTKRTSNNTSRPLQWHHKRRGAMTSGHLAAPSEAAGSITLKGSTRYISSYPAITHWSWPPCAGPTTKRTSNNTSRPLQWHHKRRGAMTSGHLAAPSEAAGSITLKGSTRYT